MHDTEKRKPAPETANKAEMRGSIIFLHRLNWGLDGHPKLHRLLTEMHEAGEPPTAPAPVIEIRFRDTRYYLLPEQIADWGLRLYSDYVQTRPPFTREMLAALLSGDDAKKNAPEADFPKNA